MSAKSRPYNRVLNYLRNNRVNYKTNRLWISVQNFTIQDLPKSEVFRIRCKPLFHHYFDIPHCEPDRLLSKAYEFQKLIAKLSQQPKL